jgi:broad specificity phosphatase PhoE
MKDRKTCHIYLVRHGETDWNALGKFQGHTDIPLNEKGRLQALVLKQELEHVNFDAVFCSDLSRACQTAELIIGSRPLSIFHEYSLRERFMGKLEGSFSHDLDQWMRPAFQSLLHAPKEVYLSHQWHPEVETTSAVFKRMHSFLLTQIPHYLGSTILVVSHGGVIRSVLDHLDFKPGYKWIVGNCGFIQLEASPSELRIVQQSAISSQKFI